METASSQKHIEQILQVQAEVTKSLNMGILCSLEPAGVPYLTYHQNTGEVRYTSSIFHVPVAAFLNTPFHLASNVVGPVSDLVKSEMAIARPRQKHSSLLLLAKYPFIFVTYGLVALEGFEVTSNWDALQDITCNHFISVGGKTRIGVDAIGFVIAQESQPGSLIEAAGFAAPSSVIAPGYSEEHIALLRKQESNCLFELLKPNDSPLSSFIEEVSSLDTSHLGIKAVYGVSTAPFNNIEKVVSQIAIKRKRKILK